MSARPLYRFACALTAWVVLCGSVGCSPPPPLRSPKVSPPPPHPPKAAPVLTLTGPPGLPSTVVAELASPDREVRFARNGQRGVLLTRGQGRWLTGGLLLDAEGRAKLTAAEGEAAMRQVADAPEGEMAASLQAVGDGFVLAWVSTAGDSSVVSALRLNGKGEAVGAPQIIDSGSPKLRWVEVLANAKGALLLWESGDERNSELYVTQLDGTAAPLRVADHVSGWHAAANPDGAAVAWVSANSTSQGTPYFATLSAAGQVSAPQALSNHASALLDIQTARVGKEHLVAWTDARSGDHHVYLAKLDRLGKLQQPARPALAPVGSQGLVALIAAQDGSRALLAWEPELGEVAGPRPIQLTMLNANGKAGARAELELWSPRGTPQLVADGSGFTALTLAPVQPLGGDAVGQGPHYVRFDARLTVQAAEPIRVAELAEQSVAVQGVPGIVRTLQCQGRLCTVVSVGDGKPALLAITALPLRRSSWRAPAKTRAPLSSPQALELRLTTAGNQPIAATSAARLEDGRTLVAWISHVPPGADGLSPAEAKLSYRFVSPDGTMGPVSLLSQRAISLGGVKVVALKPNRRFNQRNPAVAAIAWAGPNSGAAQVFVTQIGSDEKTLKQRTVTQQRRSQKGSVANEVADVDMALDPAGNLVCAWADSRDGNAEIYLARLSPMLEKTKVDQRITDAKGPSTEPKLLITPERVYLAWSDGRGDINTAAVLVTQFDTQSLASKSAPVTVTKGAIRARTPRWAGLSSKGAWLSWIENSGPLEAGTELAIAVVDSAGASSARRVRLRGERTISSATIHCSDAQGCRGALLGNGGGTLEVYGFVAPAAGNASIGLHELALLPGGSVHDLSLVTASDQLDELFFLQRGSEGEAVRQLLLEW